jgi:hypothetical protein
MAAWRGRSRIFLAVLYGPAGTLHIVMPFPIALPSSWATAGRIVLNPFALSVRFRTVLVLAPKP